MFLVLKYDCFSFFVRKLFGVKWLIVVGKDGGEAMIKSIYETHVQVRSLEDSIEFYRHLGLTFVHKIEERRCAFSLLGNKSKCLVFGKQTKKS